MKLEVSKSGNREALAGQLEEQRRSVSFGVGRKSMHRLTSQHRVTISESSCYQSQDEQRHDFLANLRRKLA